METGAETVDIRVKVIEVIGYGTVILPTVKRLQMVKLWLPFVIETKLLVDSVGSSKNDDGEEDKEEEVRCKIDGDMASFRIFLCVYNSSVAIFRPS
ncbi:hypothetical protein Bca4012_003703 [Brassica carinata]